jgi:histone H1/5
MPPKKVTSAKKAAPAPHTSYRDMIKDAIISLKERNGSSRQAIKKYVQSNNKLNVSSQSTFDAQFNKAIKSGVEKEEFTQPKGPSGPLKLFKKEAPVKAAAKPAAKPAAKAAAKPGPKTAAKPVAAKAKPGPKKAVAKTTTKATPAKRAAPKKTAATKAAKPGPKPKANSGKVRKTSTAAPAIVEQPKILSKTKSGRVIKTTAPAPKASPKKRTTKK